MAYYICSIATFTKKYSNAYFVTIKEIFISFLPGKLAVFKAKITGNPTPTVTWGRANGEIHYHPDVCLQKYDEATQEHTIEVRF